MAVTVQGALAFNYNGPVREARGGVAQLGERIVRNDEVAGSIPVSSTINSLALIPRSRRLPGTLGLQGSPFEPPVCGAILQPSETFL